MKIPSLGIVASTALLGLSLSASAVEISITCGSVGKDAALCRNKVATWEKQTGHQVKIILMPQSTTDQLALNQQWMASQSTPDIVRIDVIWPGLLANHLIDLSPYLDESTRKQYFPALIEANTVKDRLVGIPWFVTVGVLYYRKDLLEKYQLPVPTTWAELATTAKTIQQAERQAGNPKMWGFVWQGRAYEGLTCDALEWIASYGGGAIVNEKGQSTVYNPQAIRAIDNAAKWVNTLSPPGVLNYTEEEGRHIFQLGNAVFMRNWPYAWALSQNEDSPVKGKVGVTVLPKGGPNGRHAGTLGGWQLAVSKYSKHPDIAVDLVLYLTSQQIQKERTLEGSYLPTIVALYQDKAVLEANPFFAHIENSLKNAIVRPSRITGRQYNKVSTAFWNAVHSVLSGRANARDSLKRLSRRLKRISRNRR
jgi:trehalose/maltose transport system substrate-binding protein